MKADTFGRIVGVSISVATAGYIALLVLFPLIAAMGLLVLAVGVFLLATVNLGQAVGEAATTWWGKRHPSSGATP